MPRCRLKILVCGGRDFNDRDFLFRTLDQQTKPNGEVEPARGFVIIHGGANGADSLANEWARLNRVPCVAFPADWKKHGRAAGHIRNRRMLEERPDIVIAFAGGKGTAYMVKIAKEAGVQVFEPKGGAA